MPSLKILTEELQQQESIKLVTESLGEVAAIRLRSTRRFIEHNSLFYKEIVGIYRAIKIIAAKRNRDLGKKKKSKPNNTTVSILLTSNSPFFGGLDLEVTQDFIASSSRYSSDRIVVGIVGRNFMLANKISHFDGVIFQKDQPSPSEVQSLAEKVRKYGKIFIYHPRFVTVLDQRVTVSDLSENEEQTKALKVKIDYILEPEVDKMLAFFEGQLMGALLQSVFLQAQLARTAARMVSMDQADLNAEKEIDKEKKEIIKAKKALKNLRILETYNSMRNLHQGG